MSRQDERGWNVTAWRAEASEGWPEAYVGWSVVCRVWMECEERWRAWRALIAGLETEVCAPEGVSGCFGEGVIGLVRINHH